MKRSVLVAIVVLVALAAGGGTLRLLVDAARPAPGWSIDAIGLAPRALKLPDDPVVWRLRLMSVASAAVIGVALGVAGLLMQSMLRNPLASPYILGVTSGAGVAIVASSWLSYLATGMLVAARPPMAAAVIGAVLTLGAVYTLSRRRGAVDPTTLVLTGIIVSLTLGAVTTLFQSLLPDQGMAYFTRWVMGSIRTDTPWSLITGIGVMTLAATALAVSLGPSMDAAMLSDDEAQSVGVRLGVLRALLLVIAGVLTAGTVVLAGPIGFVGLVAPHAARLLVGHTHRILIVGTALAGAALLLAAESLVAWLRFQTGQIPVGVVTALVGGPVFILLYRRGGAGPGVGGSGGGGP